MIYVHNYLSRFDLEFSSRSLSQEEQRLPVCLRTGSVLLAGRTSSSFPVSSLQLIGGIRVFVYIPERAGQEVI